MSEAVRVGARVVVALLGGGLWVSTAQAQFQPYGQGFPVQDLGAGIAGIVQAALFLVGVTALGFIVYGGFKYITSKGDERSVEEAKTTITYAVVGVLFIGLAYAIVTFVFRALGAGGGAP